MIVVVCSATTAIFHGVARVNTVWEVGLLPNRVVQVEFVSMIPGKLIDFVTQFLVLGHHVKRVAAGVVRVLVNRSPTTNFCQIVTEFFGYHASALLGLGAQMVPVSDGDTVDVHVVTLHAFLIAAVERASLTTRAGRGTRPVAECDSVSEVTNHLTAVRVNTRA